MLLAEVGVTLRGELMCDEFACTVAGVRRYMLVRALFPHMSSALWCFQVPSFPIPGRLDATCSPAGRTIIIFA